MMNARASRGSFVFAGTFDQELINNMQQPSQKVESLFDVIGELATCRSGELVEAVIVDEHTISHEPNSSIDAIRRVDPTTIIVVVGKTFYKQADACVPIETTVAGLKSAIANANSLPHNQQKEVVDLDTVLGISDQIELQRDGSPLGDLDLVRSLLHKPIQFRDTLVELLKEQTGWAYCEIVDDASCAPATAKTTPLRYGHEEHGCLVALGATSNELQRWGRWVACWLELHRKQRNLKLLAYQDELSGAWNRRFLNTCFTRELQLARNSRRPLTVMIFDIDDFKQYNDKWGHEAGDEIIREVVKLLRTIIRKGDHVCRIGGDEFAVLFCDPEPPREHGSKHPTSIEILARRFKEQVAKARFPKLGEDATGVLSISGGLATFPWDGIDVDEIIKKADERLFQSKRQGKNSITIGRTE